MTRPDVIPPAPIKDGASVPGEVRELVAHLNGLLVEEDDDHARDLIDAETTGERPDLNDREIVVPRGWLVDAVRLLATRTTQEARDEAVRQRAVEDCLAIASKEQAVLYVCRNYELASEEEYQSVRKIAAGIAALRKPANEEGGERG